jgi:hypothetical protein
MPEGHSNAPTPATAIKDRTGWDIRMMCGNCHRYVALACDDLARTLGGSVPLWRVVCRMRCRECGAVPARVDLLHGVDAAATMRAVKVVRPVQCESV